MSTLNLNYFELFGLNIEVSLELEELNKKYLILQAKFHPDKFINSSNMEKSLATRNSTYINDAYNTLKDLVSRVDYILKINNYNVDENKTFKNTDFLTMQIDLSEKITQCKSTEHAQIKEELVIKIKQLISEMEKNLSDKKFDILHENISMVKFYKKSISNLS